jgi:GntR family transcriptional regulator/MocR family aminotransferase
MILHLDRQNHTPLYLQITSQVKALIAEGTLKVGAQLPPTRELASTLGVHRTTVNNAYAELEADGIIQSHVGRGTFVSANPRTIGSALALVRDRPSFSPLFWNALFVGGVEDERLHNLLHLHYTENVISFAYALPSPELFPLDDIKRCVDRVLRRDGRTVLQMGESIGYAPLREYLVGILAAAGIRVKRDEILITNGCQQSLDLIRRVLVGEGETVVLENPTYPGVFSVFDTKGIKCVSVPVGENGLDLNALEDVLSHRRVKLIYTVPTFHNPTGVTMDLAARRRLLDLALKYRVPIIEDDIYGELRYDGPALPSLKALDQNGVVIYLGSISKAGFPGLRVGWMAAPSIVVDRLSIVKQASDLHTNMLAQAALCELSKHGLLARHVKRVRRAYAERRHRLLEALAKHFPDEASWSHPEGGMSVWVTLPPSLDATHILSLAKQEGIIFSPGINFYLTSPQPNTMRLTFTTVTPTQIDEGIKRLGVILKRQLSLMRARPARMEPAARTALV